MKPVNSVSRHLQWVSGTQHKQGVGGFADSSGHWDLTTGRMRQASNQAVTCWGAREDSVMLLLVEAPFTRKANARRGWAFFLSKPGEKLAMAKVGWGPEMLTQHLPAAVSDRGSSVGCAPTSRLMPGALTGTPAWSDVFIRIWIAPLKSDSKEQCLQ